MNAISGIVRPSNLGVKDRATAIARARYDRIALYYGWMPVQWMVGNSNDNIRATGLHIESVENMDAAHKFRLIQACSN